MLFYAFSAYAYYPPDPTIPGSYLGDADGDEYMTMLDIPALETQANAGLSLDFATMQPNNDDQRWNTCDADGDGYCTVLDLPYLYKVADGGIIDQSPFSAWQISNYNLPTSGNLAGEWIPFQLSVTADPGYGMGATGRPGMIVKVTIVSEGSTITGKLSGRSCTPNYWGDPDQLNAGNDQCAVGVSISDWVNHTADALTEDAADSMGLKVLANGGGTLHLHAEVAAVDSFLIPAFSNDFYVSFSIQPVISAVAAGGFHTCALTSGGSVKCWGYNGNGQLGDNSNIDKAYPVNVVGLSSGVTAISAGGNHTCAVTSSGGVKCWGNNSNGQLGDNSGTQGLTPVDVCADATCSTSLTAVTAIAAGGYHTCAVAAGGVAKCWGQNNGGQMGIGPYWRVVPVDVLW